MRIKNLSLLVIALCMLLTHQTLLFNQLHRYSRVEIERDPFIEIFSSSSNEIEDLHKEFLILKVIQRQKRSAYFKLVQIEDKMARTLKKYDVMQDEELIKSITKPHFSSANRKWSYSMVFALVGEEEELIQCFRELSKFGIQRLHTHPTINYLNQKIKSIDAFNKAKWSLTRSLRKFPKLEIKSVESIEIFGAKIENSNILQDQLQRNNDSDELLDQTQLGELQSIQSNMKEQGEIDMKIIFKVGHAQGTPDEDYESDDYDSQNYSIDDEYSEYSQ